MSKAFRVHLKTCPHPLTLWEIILVRRFNPFTQRHTNVHSSGPRSDRKTDFRPDQAEYSPDNLPEIIYAFEQPVNYYGLSKLKEPPPKSYTIHGEQVRDIPILPDRISPDPEGWLYEYWSRMDPRIRYDKDIAPRIRPDLRPLYPTRFSMSRRRFRVDCYILGWVVKGKIFEKSRNEILSAGLKAGIDVEGTNSTRGLSWGLVDPSRGESGGRIEVPDRLRPKNTRVHGPAGVSVPPTLGGSHSGNEDAQRTHHQYQMIPAQVGPPQSPLSQSLTSEVLASSRAMISGAPRFLAEAPTIIGEPSSPSQVPQSQAINGHIDDMLQPDIAVSNDTDQKLKHWETAMLYAQNFPTHDFGQSYTSQPLNRFCGLPPRGFMDGSQQRSSSSQGRIPNVYEGYAEANEMFVQDVSGTYLPLPAMQTVPAKPNTLPCFLGPLGTKPYGARANDHSFQNFQMSRESSIHPRAATEHLDGAERTVQTLRQSAFSKKQHREYSFYQKDEILHHAAKHAIKHNLNKPSEEETVAMNMVVEGFYARDNVPLLYTVDHEWESTRLDFAEFYDRVKFNPVHFHEYFPLLVRDIKEYTRQTLGKPLAGSRTTSWPDSRVPAEQVLYNTVWNFERRRWNQYTKSSSSAEPF